MSGLGTTCVRLCWRIDLDSSRSRQPLSFSPSHFLLVCVFAQIGQKMILFAEECKKESSFSSGPTQASSRLQLFLCHERPLPLVATPPAMSRPPSQSSEWKVRPWLVYRANCWPIDQSQTANLLQGAKRSWDRPVECRRLEEGARGSTPKVNQKPYTSRKALRFSHTRHLGGSAPSTSASRQSPPFKKKCG